MRYYSAMLGRFINKDPLGYLFGMNPYEYGAGNPERYVDPLGLGWGDWVWGAVVGFTKALPVAYGTGVILGIVSAVPVIGPAIALGVTIGLLAYSAADIYYEWQIIDNDITLTDEEKDYYKGQILGGAVGGVVGGAGGFGRGRGIGNKLFPPKPPTPSAPPVESKGPPRDPGANDSVAGKPEVPVPCPPKGNSGTSASAKLPQVKGRPLKWIHKQLEDAGFRLQKKSSVGNETWTHPDGSKVRIDPYGNQKISQFKTANNAHVHKEGPNGETYNDRGIISADKGETHIGISNPPNLPTVRERPHGAGSK